MPETSTDQRETEIHAAHVADTVERAPSAVVPPVVLAGAVVSFFWGSPRWLVPAGVVGALCVLALIVVILGRAAQRRGEMSGPATLRGAAILAGLMGAAWAVLPFTLFPTADASQRFVLLGALCGAIGNVFLIGPAWPVGLVYVVPLIFGGVGGLFGSGDLASATVGLMLLAAGSVVGAVLDRNRRLASTHVRGRLEVGDQAFTIERLLLDFEETTHEWLWETDARLKLVKVAARMAEAIGRNPQALEGKTFKSLLRPPSAWTDASEGTAAVIEAMTLRVPFRNCVVAVETAEGLAWWRLSARPVLDSQGRFIGFRGIGSDITAARNAEARIAYLANHDACTGLPNRIRFHAHVEQETLATAQGGRGGALLSLDLDGFKSVNDRLGHAAGDEVLKEVARRLTRLLPTDAMVARLGGDEFALWCPTAVPGRATALAEDVIAAIGAPLILPDGAQVEIGASVGIAITPKHGIDPDQLLVRADLALYEAKANGKCVCRTFIDDYERSLIEKRALEADLRLAVARQEFELHYQPIVDVAEGRVVAFETLIRWRSATRGFVSPADFIPAAEAAGLIVAIDRWVLQRACRDAMSWPNDIHVAVNVSPHHFRDGTLVHDIRLALQLSGLDAQRLDVEVTEGVFLDQSAAAIATLGEVRRLGVSIALDDFGTGYSSLSYLISFPIDKIKIDRAFVRDFIERHESRAIVDAILSLARKLEIKVVAEGVETAEQALALKLRRCDQIQGYLLSKPQPQTAVPAMLAGAAQHYRDAVPTHVDSALGMALALKQQAV